MIGIMNALYNGMRMTEGRTADRKEIRQIVREMAEHNTAGLKSGRMCEPLNGSHIGEMLRRRGIAQPVNVLDWCEWAKEWGFKSLGRKLAKEGHWIKGCKNTQPIAPKYNLL